MTLLLLVNLYFHSYLIVLIVGGIRSGLKLSITGILTVLDLYWIVTKMGVLELKPDWARDFIVFRLYWIVIKMVNR